MGSKRYGIKPIEWWKHMKWHKKTMNKKLRQLGKFLSKNDN